MPTWNNPFGFKYSKKAHIKHEVWLAKVWQVPMHLSNDTSGLFSGYRKAYACPVFTVAIRNSVDGDPIDEVLSLL